MSVMVVQVRVRLITDPPLMEWSDRLVVAEFHVAPIEHEGKQVWAHNMTGTLLNEKVEQIAKCYTGAVETRWNFKESLQGHYNFVR